MYDYFPDKNELVQAVIDYQADTIVKHNRQALGSPKGVEAWRKMMVTGVRSTKGKGPAHLIRSAARLAEKIVEARALGVRCCCSSNDSRSRLYRA